MDAHKTVTVNNQLNPELKMTSDNPKTFLYLLFQISHSLMTAQQKHRLTHYDLHIENILWDEWSEQKEKKYISYPLPGKINRLVIPKVYCPFILKISDFALSRLETKKAILSPLVDDFPEKTYGEFNPSYDIMSLIGTILIDNKYRVAFDPIFENLDTYKFMLIFTLWVLNDKEIKINKDSNLDDIRDQIGNKYYTSIGNLPNKFNFRPKKDGDFVTYTNTKSLNEVVNFLAKVLEVKKYALLSNSFSEKVLFLKKLNKYKEYNDILVYSPEIKIDGIPKNGETLSNFKEKNIDQYIQIRSHRILQNSPPKDYNFTIEDKQLEECPIQEHFITTVKVSKNYDQKYKFGYDCCKLDPTNYLLGTSKKGFIINGGFFAIKDDYLPIGTYKDKKNFIEKYMVPEKYKDMFRYVTLKNNELSIKKQWNEEDQIFTAGPILIENRKIAFDPYDNRFHCNDLFHAGNTVLELTENSITTSGHYKYEEGTCNKEFVNNVETYLRCDKIQPGQLSHANNPNPRSAFAILSNGDYMFLTVEGRSKRGIGMDLYGLSKYALENFDVVNMINLDGGRSSVIAWRDDDKVYISNADRNYAYPVGNILYLLNKN